MATKGKQGKIIFTDSDINFLKENFHLMTNSELAAALKLKRTTVRTKGYELGLKRMELEYWTDVQVKFLQENFRTIGDVEIAEIFENEFPKKKPWTKKHIDKKRGYLKLIRSQAEIKAIHQRNKTNGRFSQCAKKRWETTGINEVGTIVVWNTNGHPIANIKTENGYVHYARWLWQKVYGEIPEKHNVVRKKGCPEIPTIEFLELISKEEHSRRNRLKFTQLPTDLKEIITLKNKIAKTIKDHDKRIRK